METCKSPAPKFDPNELECMFWNEALDDACVREVTHVLHATYDDGDATYVACWTHAREAALSPYEYVLAARVLSARIEATRVAAPTN